jgi:DNA-binding transcriptional ArsR family regulator
MVLALTSALCRSLKRRLALARINVAREIPGVSPPVCLDDRIARICKALSDDVRLGMLVQILAEPGIIAGRLVGLTSLTQPVVSHHLRILYEADLVTATKVGASKQLRVNQAAFEELTGTFAAVVRAAKPRSRRRPS